MSIDCALLKWNTNGLKLCWNDCLKKWKPSIPTGTSGAAHLSANVEMFIYVYCVLAMPRFDPFLLNNLLNTDGWCFQQ